MRTVSPVPVIACHLTPAYRQMVHRLDDPDEFSVAVSGAELSAFFLARQARPTRIEQFQSRDWAIDFHEAHVRARISGPLPKGWASLGLMFSRDPSAWYGFDAPQGTLVCTPPGYPIDGCTTPGFRCVSIGMAPEVWDQCRLLAGAGREVFGSCTAHRLHAPMFENIGKRAASLRQLLRETARAPRMAGRAAEEARRFVLDLGTTAWEISSNTAQVRDSARNRARLARRAEEWMREHQSTSFSVPRLCAALQVSRRELEYAFQMNFNTSPRAYLHGLRLHSIRRALLASGSDGASIMEVAHEHGVMHLGRLSASYHALFGEMPSATLRR